MLNFSSLSSVETYNHVTHLQMEYMHVYYSRHVSNDTNDFARQLKNAKAFFLN